LGGAAPSPKERWQVAWEHFEAYAAWVGNREVALKSFRKQWGYYSHGLEGASAFRAAMFSLSEESAVRRMAQAFFVQAKQTECKQPFTLEGPG